MNAMQSFFAVTFAAGVAATLAAGLPLSTARAAQPPSDLKSMIEVVEQLEGQGYGPFIEVDFDRGNWEVEVYKADTQYELTVDGRTGKVLSEYRDDAEPRPPADAQPLSKLLHTLTQAGYTSFDDASFERRYWEIECYRADGEHEIHVNPTTAEVVSDRRDD